MNKEYDKQSGIPGHAAEPDGQEVADQQSGEAELTSHLGMSLIGEQLRKSYKELLSEPVPDRFLKILEEMESKETDKDEK